jgi:hypothetical protein
MFWQEIRNDLNMYVKHKWDELQQAAGLVIRGSWGFICIMSSGDASCQIEHISRKNFKTAKNECPRKTYWFLQTVTMDW